MANPQFTEATTADKPEEKLSYEAERGLIKLQRQIKPEEVESANENHSSSKTMPALVRTPSKIQHPIDIPLLYKVENIDKLDIFIDLYCAFIDRNIIANPMSEIYFVVHLITLQFTKSEKVKLDFTEESIDSSNSSNNVSLSLQELKLESLKEDLGCAELTEKIADNSKLDDSDKEIADVVSKPKKTVSDGYFDTVHNCVYFAANVLDKQREILQSLDRGTLKLLTENSNIASFKPDLCIYLTKHYNAKLEKSQKAKEVYNVK